MKKVRHYTIELKTLEPFRVGALKDELSAIDNPIATVGGKPVVQGPSLKGALRSAIEEYLIDKYAKEPAMKPCIPSSERSLSQDEKELIKKGLYRSNGSCHYSERARSESICPVCYLLGAQGCPGFVRVPFLFTDKTPEELYSVRVDRATRVVAEGTNREYQILSDGVSFRGQMDVLMEDTANCWKLGEKRPVGQSAKDFVGDAWLTKEWTQDRILKELLLDRLTSIEILGGFKSKGCGKVKVGVAEVKS